MATPPILDTGILWIFLSPGISTSPSFLEKAITNGTINTPIMYDITAPIMFIPTVSDNLIKIVLPSYYSYKGNFLHNASESSFNCFKTLSLSEF